MRASIFAVTILLVPATAAKADIISACYTDCAGETESNVELKACLSRAANKADRLLNQSYQTLQEARQARHAHRHHARGWSRCPDLRSRRAGCRRR